MNIADFKLPRYDAFGHCITRACTIKAINRGALNLSQGFPEEEPVEAVAKAASDAILRGPNQYADMRGLPALREAVALRYRERFQMPWVDPDKHVSITCGTTEGMAAAVLATVGPGDEIVIQEPTYENYPPQAILAGASIRYLVAEAPEWRITRKSLEDAFSKKTRAIILNSPNNPTGRVYSREELELISEFCQRFDTIALADEIYEHLVWNGAEHIRLATLPGMEDRTVTISGASKVYAVTGWRVGWAVAPEKITTALRRVHDFLTATVPTPLQAAIVVALHLPDEYYSKLTASYERRRSLLMGYLDRAGLQYYAPEGAYYLFPSCNGLGFRDSVEFSDYLLEEAGVAVVPHTAFFKTPSKGTDRFRINFAKKEGTLVQAGDRLVDFCLSHQRSWAVPLSSYRNS
jgi:aminotransferase